MASPWKVRGVLSNRLIQKYRLLLLQNILYTVPDDPPSKGYFVDISKSASFNVYKSGVESIDCVESEMTEGFENSARICVLILDR